VFLDSSDGVAVAGVGFRPYICRPRKGDVLPEYLIGYFKSAVYIWFLERCREKARPGGIPAFPFDLPILMPSGKDVEESIAAISSRIIELEHEYLLSAGEIYCRDLSTRDRNRAIDELALAHSVAAGRLVRSMDDEFLDILKASPAERTMIRDVLRAEGMTTLDQSQQQSVCESDSLPNAPAG
jgi:hypothetical protein